jgi:uncharacterized OsmC-like protein
MLDGEWRTDEALAQFGGVVKFPQSQVLFEADFPPFLGGEGRAPTPLAYCFYGAMCCYGATFATQAAMARVRLRSLRIAFSLTVDFHAALGLGDVPLLSPFEFDVEIETDASDEDVQLVKKLADERCPAILGDAEPCHIHDDRSKDVATLWVILAVLAEACEAAIIQTLTVSARRQHSLCVHQEGRRRPHASGRVDVTASSTPLRPRRAAR